MHIPALCLVLAVAPAGLPSAADGLTELLPHQGLEDALRSLAAGHPDLVEPILVARSRGGRSVEALRLAAPDAPADRPAILLVANVEGPRLFSSAVALHHARRLAAGYGEDEAVTALLDQATVYVLPRLNPDAAEARCATPLHERWASGPGLDDDRDGRQGEDPPGDVNGDGLVTWMRVPDPEGTWLADPHDPRATIEADRDLEQRGRWKLVREGRDSDGDGEASEDAPLDARVDRNFSSGWEAHTGPAGRFPMDEPEVRGLAEFFLAHPDLALVVHYGSHTNLVGKPKTVGDDAPSVKRVPPPGLLESDSKPLARLAKRYRELTENEAEAKLSDAGSFPRWSYDHRGLLTLSAVLWTMPEEPPAEEEEETDAEGETEGEPSEGESSEEVPGEAPEETPGDEAESEEKPEGEPSREAKRLEWIDGSGEGERFVAWEAFEHPELGPVEIGGLAPYATLEPPADEWEAIADAHFEFFLGLGADLPRVRIVSCTATDLGGGLLHLEAAIENDALLPLPTRAARRARTVRPPRVFLIGPAGDFDLLAGRSQTLLTDGIAGTGGRVELEWLVSGVAAEDLGVVVETDNAGSDLATPEVVR